MRTRVVLVVVGVLSVVLGTGTGYELGRHHTAAVVWHTGQAYIGEHEASMTTPGWTYGFESSVPWIDVAGAYHGDGWPDCVNPSGTQKLVTFATTTVTVNGATSRPVVLVDCRGR